MQQTTRSLDRVTQNVSRMLSYLQCIYSGEDSTFYNKSTRNVNTDLFFTLLVSASYCSHLEHNVVLFCHPSIILFFLSKKNISNT